MTGFKHQYLNHIWVIHIVHISTDYWTFKKLLSTSSLIYLWKFHYHYLFLLTNSVCSLAIIFSLSVITNGAESCLIFFPSILFLSCFYFPLHIDLKISQKNQFIKKLFECFSQHTGFHSGISSDSSSHSNSPSCISFLMWNTRKLFKSIFLKVWYPMLWSVESICMIVVLQLAMEPGETVACYNQLKALERNQNSHRHNSLPSTKPAPRLK